VTVAGEHRPLPKPFHVLATQNPIEQEGTYPLPEAQLDRFLLQIDVPYPTADAERDILLATTGAERRSPSRSSRRGADGGADAGAADAGGRDRGRGDPRSGARLPPRGRDGARLRARNVAWGPGPRAAQALMLTVRAKALLDGRLAPSVADVAALARPVLKHRMALTFAARAEGA
jgi:MoxR-like ATPase